MGHHTPEVSELRVFVAPPAGSLVLLPQKVGCDLSAVGVSSPAPSLPICPAGLREPSTHHSPSPWVLGPNEALCIVWCFIIIPSSTLDGGLVTSQHQNEAHKNADSAVTRQPGPRTCAGTLRTLARWLGRDLAERRLSPCSRCLPRASRLCSADSGSPSRRPGPSRPITSCSNPSVLLGTLPLRTHHPGLCIQETSE